MQVSHRALRLAVAALLCGWLAAGCQVAGSGRPPPTAVAVERAAAAAAQGDHAAAARQYEAATRSAAPVERNQLWLAAAWQWLQAREPAAAETALARVGPELAVADRQERARLNAELALARGGAAPALALLAELPAGASAETEATRARILFRAGRAAEAVRALIAREALVSGTSALLANRRLILDGLAGSRRAGGDLRSPPDGDALLAGWLELGRILADAEAGGFGVQRRLQGWRARYPAHPATEELWRDRLAPPAGPADRPRQIALLLPLSGRAEGAGGAVRDGFLAAFYDSDGYARPRLRIYDVAASEVPVAYRQAVADGCDLVVGPLTREDVLRLAAAADGRSEVLALNFLPDGSPVPGRFYQFALSPEDEARQVARRVVADGRPAGVALAPDSDWGRRTLAAFAAELATQGGRLVGQAGYPTGAADFNEVVRQLLQTSGERDSPRRADAQFVFVVAQPVSGRLIRSQLRFNYAGDLPVYATSDIYEPGGAANLDLDGVALPEMPWNLATDGPAATARETANRVLGARAAARGRLYAFGYDAFRIAAELHRLAGRAQPPLPGVTGRLALDGDGRVHRQLDWARIDDGRLAPLP